MKNFIYLFFLLTVAFKATALELNTAKMIPASQQSDAHPRLYITTEKINLIKSRLDQQPYAGFWTITKKEADDYSIEAPPQTIQQMKDAPIREYGDRIPFLALAYLLTEDEKYLNSTRRWMNALASYENWASNTDLGAAHLLFGMSIAYDWLYDKWTEDERARFRQKISRHANILYQILIKEKLWWTRRNYLMQNHNHANVMSIAVAGIALQGEASDAANWRNSAESNFKQVLSLLSPDGASYEGVAYWGYSMDSLLKYYLASPKYDRHKTIKNTPYFRNASKFRLYTSLPGYADNVDYADSPRFDWYGPGYILRALSSIFNDGHAQWLASRIEKARGIRPYNSWLNLIWYDDSVTPIPPDKLPTFVYFDNLGIFISRSSWSDDASWVFFKAGPSQGKLAESLNIYTDGHIHPDAGNFLLWANGNWQVIEDGDIHKKRTENHNVLLFNKTGQLGEGNKWFDLVPVRKHAATSKITYLDLQPEYQYLVADIEKMYTPKAGIKSWSRSFIWLPPDNLVIHDDITLSKPGQVTGRVHLATEPEKLTPNEACISTGNNGDTTISYFSNGEALMKPGSYKISEKDLTYYTNKSGGLIELISKNNNPQTLLFSINPDACSMNKGYNKSSMSDGELKIRNLGIHADINFKSRKVLLHKKPLSSN